ncbi:MAG: HD domain-containing protein [Candidatus Marsarchaeota archaeon]|nr:HD domain-containing protein [Candidatus Marsarchaeota archaeon]
MAAEATKSKFIRDPIHDLIRIRPENRFIMDLIGTGPMQRLRRIAQLGLARLVYPGAEHSRFTHSIGVFHLAERVMNQLEEESERPIFEGHREAVLAAALLHDVGHGPFSHIFEKISKRLGLATAVKHEAWTSRVITENDEIARILSERSIVEQVGQILSKIYSPHYVMAIISSQLDVDRFDYLLRDSYMTGTHYGEFDLEWMLRTLAVRKVRVPGDGSGMGSEIETVVVDGRRGLSGLEEYLLGRHYMYQHVVPLKVCSTRFWSEHRSWQVREINK